MSSTVVSTIPSPEQILRKIPITAKEFASVVESREILRQIIAGTDRRKILFIGPCSAWPSEAVVEYAGRLTELMPSVKDRVQFVLRTYISKPRTTVGWTGPMNQPDPYADPDIPFGICYCRKMMKQIASMGLPVADEAVYTHNDPYVFDLLSWVAIGARSSEDPEHRAFASMMDVAVGLKNPRSGDIEVGVNSVIAAQYPHMILEHRSLIQTSGNPWSHLILRGGKGVRNYDRDSLITALQIMESNKVKNPSVIVDASHDNCVIPETGVKDFRLQPAVVSHVLDAMHQEPRLRSFVKGFMVESFLVEGKQNIGDARDDLVFGKSITDPCIGWDDTKALIQELYDRLASIV